MTRIVGILISTILGGFATACYAVWPFSDAADDYQDVLLDAVCCERRVQNECANEHLAHGATWPSAEWSAYEKCYYPQKKVVCKNLRLEVEVKKAECEKEDRNCGAAQDAAFAQSKITCPRWDSQ